MTRYMCICTGAHEGQRFERAVNMIIFFTALIIAIIIIALIIAIIHILSSIIQLFTYNSADIQACYLAKKADIQSSWNASETYCEMSKLASSSKVSRVPSTSTQFVHVSLIRA